MKKIAVTIGDPGGIGPEIVTRALESLKSRRNFIPLVIGDAYVLRKVMALLKSPLELRIVAKPEECVPDTNIVNLLDMKIMKKLKKSRPDEENGRVAAAYIRKAVDLALNKEINAVVTAPISKESLKMAGFRWPGHTEMIADLSRTEDFAMMLVGGPLRVILVTIHTALKRVPALISRQRVLKTIRLAKKACHMLKIESPRIAVAGLNPHAGEAGIFGNEEIEEIMPALRDARKEGISVSGPYPPDTVFHMAYKKFFDIVVCMYHDQGLIPLKMIAFEKGVNLTVGLPFIRTSPDHGTAYDIAWKGIANPSSIIEAIKLAAKLKM
ncbi:MAG: 4-hydroxythreonine-4-phosphate dehydrogenase PdxA [Nitrospirota bacterium]